LPDNFLEEVRFFLPSPGLTEALVAAVEAVRISDQIRAREDREQTEDVDEDYLRNLPPDEPAQVSPATPHGSEEEEVFLQRRFIAEELYHHLAFLSRSPPAKRGHPLPIREAVAGDMGNVLGLSRDAPLLGRLADEFTGWLRELGQFTAGWGNIVLGEGNRIYLEELRPPESDAAERPKRMFVPQPTGRRARDGRRRVSAGRQEGHESD
jgi:hypothetical protein